MTSENPVVDMGREFIWPGYWKSGRFDDAQSHLWSLEGEYKEELPGFVLHWVRHICVSTMTIQ